MLHEVWQAHHEVVEDVGPDVDAGDDLLVDEGLLQLVGLLVALLDGELLDLGELAGERLVLGRRRPAGLGEGVRRRRGRRGRRRGRRKGRRRGRRRGGAPVRSVAA